VQVPVFCTEYLEDQKCIQIAVAVDVNQES